ncbi:MAG: hypothetical protein IT514_16495 [Burkholderiales bacterium]|nr:hypothetical protein [Burkholderiales bacterium]
MDDSALRIPKKLMPLTLWVHPDGAVAGSIFLHLPTLETPCGERPPDVFNEPGDFVAVKRDEPEDLRFYNKSAIVRVTYWDAIARTLENGQPRPCRITLMDGSLIDGEICKAEPQERSRLYDYMNDTRERFLELHNERNEVTLVNKSYVVFISARPDPAPAPAPVPARQRAWSDREIEAPLELAE